MTREAAAGAGAGDFEYTCFKFTSIVQAFKSLTDLLSPNRMVTANAKVLCAPFLSLPT